METDILREHIVSRLSESFPDNLDMVLSGFEIHRFSKGRYLLKTGEICRNVYFVSQGALQVSYTDDEGGVWVRDLITENQWCCSLESFLNETPGTEEIKCLEPAVILSVSRENFIHLKSAVPQFATIYQQIITELHIETHKRLQTLLTLNAADRIKWFYSHKADLSNRFTSLTIASYLHLNKDVFCRKRPAALKELETAQK